jgi:uncharacterized protein
LRFWRVVQPIAKRAANGRGAGRSLLIGFLWGWLPCGLVYSTLLLAALSGSALRGAGVMLAFGLGTLPAMLGSSLAGARVSRWLDAHGRRKWSGALPLVFGVWLAWVALPRRYPEGHQGHAHISEALRD